MGLETLCHVLFPWLTYFIISILRHVHVSGNYSRNTLTSKVIKQRPKRYMTLYLKYAGDVMKVIVCFCVIKQKIELWWSIIHILVTLILLFYCTSSVCINYESSICNMRNAGCYCCFFLFPIELANNYVNRTRQILEFLFIYHYYVIMPTANQNYWNLLLI